MLIHAWLRAQQFLLTIPCILQEQPQSRYQESFKKQFREQELRSLRQRTVRGRSGAPESACLVAVWDGEGVVGTVDIRPPGSVSETGLPPQGVPPVSTQTLDTLPLQPQLAGQIQ
jgi:hypothetical protein